MPYNIRGSEYLFPTEPFLHDGKHYVPLRDVTETLGGTLTYDNNTKTATATIATYAATVVSGNRQVDVSGTPVTLTADPYIENGEFYVPYDFFRDAYGYKVTFDNDTVTIVNPNE